MREVNVIWFTHIISSVARRGTQQYVLHCASSSLWSHSRWLEQNGGEVPPVEAPCKM